MIELSQIASSLPKLKSLDLSYNGLGDKSATYLKDILHQCQCLTKLSLKSCCLTTDLFTNYDVSFLCHLSELDLSYNRLGLLGLVELISVLKKSTVLKSVSVNASSDSEDEKKIVDLFSSLQDMTQNNLEFIAF